MFCLKRKSPGEAGRSHAVQLALAVGSAHRAPSGRLDRNGVQEGPQGLSEGPAKRGDTGAGVGSRMQTSPAGHHAQLCPRVQQDCHAREEFSIASFHFLTEPPTSFSQRGSLHSRSVFSLLGSPPQLTLPSYCLCLYMLVSCGLNRLATYREPEFSVLPALVFSRGIRR